MRRIIDTSLVFCGLVIAGWAMAAPDLKWDLTYQSALQAYPIGDNEFMRIWPSRYPTRPIHEKLAAYKGEEIEASVLIEQPDGHTGDPSATWFVKTKSSAMACSFHPKYMNQACKTLDPLRTEEFIRDVMNFKPLQYPVSDANIIGTGPDGKPILINYMGFLSVYFDGVAMQRPLSIAELNEVAIKPESVSIAEVGRLARAIARLTMTDVEFRKRESELEAQHREQEFKDAARSGDVSKMRSLLNQLANLEAKKFSELIETALAIAAGNGQKKSVDLLLARGAKIDATESAALKAAVQADSFDMVEYLLGKGAKIDPPKESLNAYAYIYESPLGLAVRLGKEKMARSLVLHGANVNVGQARSILAVAVLNHDLAMVDFLLNSGAKPNRVDRNDMQTPLIYLMSSSGNLSGWPKEEKEQQAILRQEEVVAKIVRRLVDSGANVNYINRVCSNAYSEAVDRHSEGMKKLLVSLGADPERHVRCQATQRQLTGPGSDTFVRESLASEVRLYLKNGDYKKLDALYQKLNNEKERTPSGVWKLAIFYWQFQNFSQRKRDEYYWKTLEQRALEWEKLSPKSVPARMFHAYILWGRAVTYRGDGPGANISKEDLQTMGLAGRSAWDVLYGIQVMKMHQLDPEWERAYVQIIPYAFPSSKNILNATEEAMKLNPYYHELYFSAAFYLQPKWFGSLNTIDLIAKDATAATFKKEKRAMYARLYWYMDEAVYHGDLFNASNANWRDMRAGFDDMIRQYPDPRNMNAYAYFACLAKDYKTMHQVLRKIGDGLMMAMWRNGDSTTYENCIDNTEDQDTFAPPSNDYSGLIKYASYLRRMARYEDSLRAMQLVKQFDKTFSGPSMQTQFHLGWTLFELGRYEEAIAAFSLGIPAQPNYSMAYWRRGLAYEALGRKAEALADFEKSAQLITSSKVKFTDEEALLREIRVTMQRYGLDKKYVF